MSDTAIATTMLDVFFDVFAERISEQGTTDFLATQLQDNHLWSVWFENLVYPRAKQVDSSYKIESWRFAKTKSEPSFFMYPDTDATYTCSGTQVDNRTFGLIVTLQSLAMGGYKFFERSRELARLCDELYFNLCAAFFAVVQELADSEDSALTQEQKDEVNAMLYLVTSCID